jgi:hypothetical protein
LIVSIYIISGGERLVTVDVANVVVKVDLSVLPLSIGALEAGPQDVTIVNTDVLGGVVERHSGRVGGVRDFLVMRGWIREN